MTKTKQDLLELDPQTKRVAERIRRYTETLKADPSISLEAARGLATDTRNSLKPINAPRLS